MSKNRKPAPAEKPVEDQVIVAADAEVVQEAAIEALEAATGKDLEIVDDVLVVVDEQIVEVIETQLNIYETKHVPTPEGAKRVVVENVGGGDMYVGTLDVHYTSEYRIAPGQKKEFKGSKQVMVGSASRPSVRITFLKK